MGCFFDTLLLFLVINYNGGTGNSMIMNCVVADNVGGMVLVLTRAGKSRSLIR